MDCSGHRWHSATTCAADALRVIECGISKIAPELEIGPEQAVLPGNIAVGDRGDKAIGDGIGQRHRQSVGAWYRHSRITPKSRRAALRARSVAAFHREWRRAKPVFGQAR